MCAQTPGVRLQYTVVGKLHASDSVTALPCVVTGCLCVSEQAGWMLISSTGSRAAPNKHQHEDFVLTQQQGRLLLEQ